MWWVLPTASPEPDVAGAIVTRVWDQLVGRVSGPMSFRFVIQPVVAAALAVRAGVRDARAHRSAFLWTLLTDASQRRTMLRSGWQDVGRLFVIAMSLDIFYQIAVLRSFYPLQALTVAGILAIVPYAAIRGLTSRAATRYRHQAGR